MQSTVYLHFWHANHLVVAAVVEVRLVQNQSHVFEDHRVYFQKSIKPVVCQHGYAKDTIVNYIAMNATGLCLCSNATGC